ncbi:hypothetical protein J5X98_12570 [Leptothermofonsia sichuanensis E412]|uniref:hypothetical protein n=1 Tax=Leptothermofonsia sichuanensis TaxID=2917832 RepID=UPI001CA605ED|nr:hypothetical protein [Leptothermofonsia sichuanensis]QZZ23088.1 hypothetical protein J5X98_12570 [Leptothermofonsia sichuanensis E412]
MLLAIATVFTGLISVMTQPLTDENLPVAIAMLLSSMCCGCIVYCLQSYLHHGYPVVPVMEIEVLSQGNLHQSVH